MRRLIFRHRLRASIPFILIWLIGGLLYAVIERGLLGDSQVYPTTGNPYDFGSGVLAVVCISLVIGFLHGLAENSIFRGLFKNRSFGLKLFLKTLLYALIIFIALVLVAIPVNSISLGVPLLHEKVLHSIWLFISDFVFVSILLYMAVFIGFALFITELMQNLGNNVVLNFFTGKYNAAVEEERVFMFLDMKASTTIAESLGHQQYYRFLNAYYQDMTNAILMTKGEIYQYVGDEIVVTWPANRGLEKANCLRCFFLIHDSIQSRKQFYLDNFGLIPEFKAGQHLGKVTTGEVGVLRKELLFTGDAINTTARIQGLCNELNSVLLISGELLDCLQLPEWLSVDSVGRQQLRGRDRPIELFAVNRP